MGSNRMTTYWVLFTLGLYMIMLILIPPKKRPKMLRYGFYLGFVQAIILNWFAVKNFKLWKLTGDILYKGIPILTCLSWIPPSIIYAYYYPYRQSAVWKAGYLLLFATGTLIVQHIQALIGMWENKHWKTIYTFPLAILTHTIMTLFLPVFKLEKVRTNQ